MDLPPPKLLPKHPPYNPQPARKPHGAIPHELSTVAQAAKIWEIHPNEIKRARQGGAVAFLNGRIQREPLVKWLAENPPTASDLEELEWKERRVKAQALKTELEIEIKKGKYIERTIVEDAWGITLSKIHAIIFRHTDRIIGNAIMAEIKMEIKEALTPIDL